jgi:hypothetical protein
MGEVRSIMDPFNNKIYLLDGVCATSADQNPEIYDDASVVIRKPAMLVEVKANDLKEMYYFRSIGWHNTMLIMVRFNNERWETFNCEKNPSNETLSGILKKGRQLI